MKPSRRHLVFVYGSLKKNHHNHHVLSSSALLGSAVTAAEYDMWSFGEFPAVVRAGRFQIAGEVYRVTDYVLGELDLLEGNGVLYRRKFIQVTMDTGAPLRCWMYVLMERESGMRHVPALSCGRIKSWQPMIEV